MQWYSTNNKRGAVPLKDIPCMEYPEFYDAVCGKLADPFCHIAHYFAHPVGNELVFFCVLLDDETSEVLLASHRYGYYSEQQLESITAKYPQMHPFEREIAELYGVRFSNNPWAKPLRYPFNRVSRSSDIAHHPFYSIEGEALHEVNVGPIHAGIIEPGAFRFICNGEKVLHLEIALGYQHRGIESLMTGTGNVLRRNVLAESIAGDTAIGHATAFAMLTEKLSGRPLPEYRLNAERALALELERIAMHIADTGALCADIGYQLGQVSCEALRTIVINTMQSWCGNRFGKGLIRPHGTRFPVDGALCELILKNINEVSTRYRGIREDLKSTPSLLARFEDCGTLTRHQMQNIGAVGQAARASGLERDIRTTHPYGAWDGVMKNLPEIKQQGDVMARLMLRGREIFRSADHIKDFISEITALGNIEIPAPDYCGEVQPSSFAFSLAEGWRGEICHCALTGPDGRTEAYKIKDPSVHNWLALALAMRGEGISDFPINNKSFNLSYCGHDL